MIRGMRSIALLACALSFASGAAEQGQNTAGLPQETAGQARPNRTFSTPELAAEALYDAVQAGDEKALSQILDGDKDIVSTGDSKQDDGDRQTFIEKYREMHRIGKDGDVTVLYVGAENWPFPIPLISRNGSWYFDTQIGGQEVRLRRIGANELSAIDICRALEELDENDAIRIVGNTAPLNGYYFRKLSATGQARPAFLAYPAEYGSSGIMTFLVGSDDAVYERDLGPRTPQLAKTMTGVSVDETWHVLE